jgi:hypothetical protein
VPDQTVQDSGGPRLRFVMPPGVWERLTGSETPADLYAAARELGLPVFLFQEGDDSEATRVFREIASAGGRDPDRRRIWHACPDGDYGETRLSEYAEKKRIEYFPLRDRYSGLFNDTRLDFIGRHAQGIIRRKSNIGEQIARGWHEGADTNVRVWTPVKKIIVPAAAAASFQVKSPVESCFVGDRS